MSTLNYASFPQPMLDMLKDWAFNIDDVDTWHTYEVDDLPGWQATADAKLTGINTAGVTSGKASITPFTNYGGRNGQRLDSIATTPGGKPNAYAWLNLGGGVGLPGTTSGVSEQGNVAVLATTSALPYEGKVTLVVTSSDAQKRPCDELQLYVNDVMVTTAKAASANFALTQTGNLSVAVMAWYGGEYAKATLTVPVNVVDLTEVNHMTLEGSFLAPAKLQAIEIGMDLQMAGNVVYPTFQLDTGDTGNLRLWNHTKMGWDDTGKPVMPYWGAWNSYAYHVSVDQANKQFACESLFLNGFPLIVREHRQYPIVADKNLPGTGLIADCQVDWPGTVYHSGRVLTVYTKQKR